MRVRGARATVGTRWGGVARCLLGGVLVCCGCNRPAGAIFEPASPTLRWPPPPDSAHIAYVGAITSDADLKPGRPAGKALGDFLFGKEPVHTMLTPLAVCTDDSGRLFVADSNAQVVHVFDLNTRKYERWKPPDTKPALSQPVGVAYDPAGRLLVSDSVAGVLFLFDTRDKPGAFLGTLGAGKLQRPCGVAVDGSSGRVFIADVGAHQVVVLGRDGAELSRIGRRGTALGEFNYPTYLALDGAGRLYVSDSLNFRVQEFGPDLSPIRQIGRKGDLPGYFSQPKGLAVDPQNHLYVVDANFEAVQLFDAEGQLLMSFGQEGTGPGEFWLPCGISIDQRGRVWIADSYNRRVQVFDALPEGKPQ